MASEYLFKPQRTLREACGDFRAAHPTLINEKCDKCPHGELCEISEQIERDRRTNDTKMKPSSLRKTA